MKKLNKILILLALLSFVSCGTASVASSSDSEKPEGSSDKAGGQTESASEKADVSEKQQSESVSETAAENASETAAENGKTTEAGMPEPEKNPNYEGTKYIGPATADFEEGLRAYSDGGCEKAVKFWQAAFSKDQ